MPTEVVMPRLGLTMTEGTIVRWLKEEGQPVEQGEPILEIETDKVTLEVEAPAGGILLKILVGAGETVPLAQLIGYIGQPGEALPGQGAAESGTGIGAAPDLKPAPTAQAGAPPEASGAWIKASPVARRLARENNIELTEVKGTGPEGRIVEADITKAIEARPAAPRPGPAAPVKASPIARRVAKEHGLDLAGLEGSGPGGRVVEADVRQAIEAGREEAAAPVEPVGPPAEIQALTSTRRLTARRMAESFQTAPHFYLNVELNAARLVEWRQSLLPGVELSLGLRLTYTDFLLRALALILPRHPLLNARWSDGQVETFSELHLGVAMATDQGLVVGVIHRAESLSLLELGQARAALAGKARESRLAPEDVTGGTFTFTNLGMFGIDDFMPILNPPQSAILAAGAIVERPFGESGQLVLRPTLRLTLAVDHRVADGVDGARFLKDLREALEQPETQLI